MFEAASASGVGKMMGLLGPVRSVSVRYVGGFSPLASQDSRRSAHPLPSHAGAPLATRRQPVGQKPAGLRREGRARIVAKMPPCTRQPRAVKLRSVGSNDSGLGEGGNATQ